MLIRDTNSLNFAIPFQILTYNCSKLTLIFNFHEQRIGWKRNRINILIHILPFLKFWKSCPGSMFVWVIYLFNPNFGFWNSSQTLLANMTELYLIWLACSVQKVWAPLYGHPLFNIFSEPTTFDKILMKKMPQWNTGINKKSCVRNVRFSENLACFAFLLPPFWDSPFCLIPAK